jgi:hypothetical protein
VATNQPTHPGCGGNLAEKKKKKKTKETVGDGLFNNLDYDGRLSREI